ncbi:cytochrome-c peroxidase [Pseudoduganella buxea]|uniref:Cytochrome c domain-containing protein n=1 Tax=Pseudoduganella buxea TaxID=1949069 RepID=A0A6I3T047_9BURK|nr:cytochrome c peroxidase [Pseudoduganella buxea]MTV54920.1 hypothetical protein [Pseudoduganella buxea]
MARRFILGLIACLYVVGSALADEDFGDGWLRLNRAKILELFGEREADSRTKDYVGLNGNAIQFGRALFFDARLSRSGNLSCASCHKPERFWTDGLQRALGPSSLNTPTLVGVHRLKWLFWDGRVIGLAHQATHPMNNPEELDGDPLYLMGLFARTGEYRSRYITQFGELPIECQNKLGEECQVKLAEFQLNVAKILGAFVASIPSPQTPFDEFQRQLAQGVKPSNFTAQNLRGLQIFLERGRCATCHWGPDFTDGQFHNVLVPEPGTAGVFSAGRLAAINEAIRTVKQYRQPSKFSEYAKSEISRLKVDSSMFGAFKTPTLRGLTCTAPYMHNGRYSTLEDVVEHYSSFTGILRPEHHNDPLVEPRQFSDIDKKDLVSFLKTLSALGPDCNN